MLLKHIFPDPVALTRQNINYVRPREDKHISGLNSEEERRISKHNSDTSLEGYYVLYPDG